MTPSEEERMADLQHFSGQRRVFALVVAVLAVAVGGRLLGGAPPIARPRFSFTVTIEGRPITGGRFREVSGLEAEVEVVEFRDGTGGPVRLLPGAKKVSRLRLARAFTGDTSLYDWFTEFSQGAASRVQGTVVVHNQAGAEVARYNFTEAWPAKYSGPTLTRDGNEVAIESIELVHEGLTLNAPDGP
jgi:phage tail-like protein